MLYIDEVLLIVFVGPLQIKSSLLDTSGIFTLICSLICVVPFKKNKFSGCLGVTVMLKNEASLVRCFCKIQQYFSVLLDFDKISSTSLHLIVQIAVDTVVAVFN